MRLLWLFVGLAVVFLVPFLAWGEHLGKLLGQTGVVAWLEHYGTWAWAAGVALLASDLFLPIPGTAVMAGLGYLYGPWWGGLISVAGSIMGGQLAYGLCRMLGRKTALRLVGEKDLRRGEQLFQNIGGWLVAWSRWLPLLPEVIACMAGLTRMPWVNYSLALACGCLPLGFTFAAVGSAGVEHPTLAILLSAFLPPLLWLAIRPVVARHAKAPSPAPTRNPHKSSAQ